MDSGQRLFRAGEENNRQIRRRIKERGKSFLGYWTVVVILAVSLFSLQSCYESQEGCLEPNAKNYSFSADTPCDGCCEFPNGNLKLFHLYEGETYNPTSDTIVNNLGDSVSIVDLIFTLSNFELVTDAGAILRVQDSLLVATPNGNLFVRDDVLVIQRRDFNNIFGTIVENERIDSLRFTIGLEPEMNNPILENADHPLLAESDSLYRATTMDYTFHRFVLAKGEQLSDTVMIEFSDRYRTSFPIDSLYTIGTDIEISLDVDYGAWVNNIDFDTADEAEIASKMSANFLMVFSKK